MSDSDGKKPLGIARPGSVKQSFSHGRTKSVVVETKRKRVVVPKPGAAKPTGGSSAPVGGDPSKRPAGISDVEMARRMKAQMGIEFGMTRRHHGARSQQTTTLDRRDHQPLADAMTLVLGQHRQRRQCHQHAPRTAGEFHARGHHMPQQPSFAFTEVTPAFRVREALGHQRDLRQITATQSVAQASLPVAGKHGFMDAVDALMIDETFFTDAKIIGGIVSHHELSVQRPVDQGRHPQA